MIAYKFVNWEVPALGTLKDSKVYQVKERLLNGQKLTREEKDWLADKLAVGHGSIKLQGWSFDFYSLLKRFIVRYYDSWYSYYAPDKTSLRRALGSGVKEIYEIPNRFSIN